MNTYKTLLVAIDLEKNTDQILKRVAELIKDHETKVIVLHVSYIEIPTYGGYFGEGLYAPREVHIDKKTTEERALDRIQNLLRKINLSTDDIRIEFGRPAETIIAIANKEKADLIVMGSHGKHGLKLLLGSTASSVLHTTSCDVLAVRIPEE